MNSLAALLVIVACHSQDTSCLEEPVSVVSHSTLEECFSALPEELERARALTAVVYGDCVPVDPDLVADRQIRKSIAPERLMAWASRNANVEAVSPQALMPQPSAIPVPLDRYK